MTIVSTIFILAYWQRWAKRLGCLINSGSNVRQIDGPALVRTARIAGTLMLCPGAARGKIGQYQFEKRWFTLVGNRCYSMYPLQSQNRGLLEHVNLASQPGLAEVAACAAVAPICLKGKLLLRRLGRYAPRSIAV